MLVRLLALHLLAGPDEDAVALRWDAPPGCPGPDEVRDRLARFVTTGAAGPRAVVDARVRTEGVGFVLELEVRIDAGVLHRRIEAARCDVLASAAALVMAVMLDPAALAESVEAAPPEPPPPVPAVVAPVRLPPPRETIPAASEPPPSPRPRTRVDVALGLRAGGGWGALPRGAATFAGLLALRIASARVELVGIGVLPQERRTAHDAGVRLEPWAVGLRGCWAPQLGPIELPLCGGVEAGQIRARGLGLAQPRAIAVPWLAWPFGVSVVWAPHRRFAIVAGVEGWVSTTRPRFVIPDLGALYTLPRAGVRALAGFEVRLGPAR